MRASILATVPEAEALESVPPDVVRRAAQALPDDLRIALYLADVEGLSHRQAALVLDRPAEMVAAMLRCARRRVRACLLQAAVG